MYVLAMQESYKHCFYRISIKALILNSSGSFALCKEANGYYDLPGGGLEHTETTTENLHRELHEETGLIITNIKSTPSYFVTGVGQHGTPLANIIYQVQVKNYTIQPSSECVALEFHNKDSAMLLPVYDNVRAFLQQFNPALHV